MNMDGTALLFEAMAAVFLAYLYGIDPINHDDCYSLLDVDGCVYWCTWHAIASMSGMQMVMLAVGIPLEAIAILLVIERPLGYC